MSKEDPRDLVDAQRGLISPKIYSDEGIYQLELEHLFARCWLFLGHESMISKPGDFVQMYMAEDPVLVTRSRDGSITAFLNQCRHRGMRICRADLGNTKAFTCTYHGWTYDLGGKLVNVPRESDAYFNELDKSKWGPRQVPQLVNYKGLLFGNWDPDAPSFEDYLGDMIWYLDSWIDRFDTGTEVLDGVHKWVIDCNWKLPAEQFASDIYHADFTHASATMALAKERNQSFEEYKAMRGEGRQFSAPMGHGTGFFKAGRVPSGGLTDAVREGWVEPARTRLGDARATHVQGHNTIFPNFSFLHSARTMRVWHPRGPGQIEVWAWTCVPKGLTPEEKNAFRINAMRTFSPAGLVEQDDGDNLAEIQSVLRGYIARQGPLNVQMGLGRSYNDPDYPGKTAHVFAEEAARGFYGRWSQLVQGIPWSELMAADRLEREMYAQPVQSL
jgi:3-phenylpropionate/trans-cinnamate dioxygenase alpha subunit